MASAAPPQFIAAVPGTSSAACQLPFTSLATHAWTTPLAAVKLPPAAQLPPDAQAMPASSAPFPMLSWARPGTGAAAVHWPLGGTGSALLAAAAPAALVTSAQLTAATASSAVKVRLMFSL
jgi:hypothetical protein